MYLLLQFNTRDCAQSYTLGLQDRKNFIRRNKVFIKYFWNLKKSHGRINDGLKYLFLQNKC